MNKKSVLSVLLVLVYFIMGVATSQAPRDLAYHDYDAGPLNINDSKHIIYFENFNSNKNNWPEGKFSNGEYYFEKGQYILSNKKPEEMLLQDIVMDKIIDQKEDWIFEVSFESMELEGDARASIIWGKASGDYMTYSYSKSNGAAILDYGKKVEGAWVGASKKVNGFIDKYKTVKLGVFKRGGSVRYYLNDKFVFTGPVEAFYGNELAVAIEGKANVKIDEIVVKQLQFRGESDVYSTDRKNTDYALENKKVVPMRRIGDSYLIPILINDQINTNFLFDTWTAEVIVSEAMAKKLIKSGTVTDYVDDIEYSFRDGDKAISSRFILNKMKVGEKEIENVECMISPKASYDVLIGEAVLSKIGTYEIDDTRKILIFAK